MSINGILKKVFKVLVVVVILNEVIVWMFGLESVVSMLVKFCDMFCRMEGGIRLVKYCVFCVGMVMMVNRFFSGFSSLGFVVILMVVFIVLIVMLLVLNLVIRRFVMVLFRFVIVVL